MTNKTIQELITDYHAPKKGGHNNAVLLERQIEARIAEARRVGQYQAANKLYSIVSTLWLFRDDPAMAKMNIERTDELLKECEKLLNHNRKAYTAYLAQLKKGLSDE